MILAGDIGGTKTNVALFDAAVGSGLPERIREGKYMSAEHAGLEGILSTFLRPGEKPEAACFGVAGPVIDGRSETPNLPWIIDAAAIARTFGIPRVLLVNDLVATAIRAETLGPADVESLNGRIDPCATGAKLVIAAGTGLGLAALVHSGKEWIPLPSEGGHSDLSARGAEQVALVSYLAERHGHVSVERAVSGPGLAALYGFIVDTGRAAPSPDVRARVAEDPKSAPQAIAEHGLSGACPASVEALRLFVDLYGAVAGNFALTVLATGGVLLGGGIAPKILPALKTGGFMRAFTDKGRFRELLENTPVAVILDSETALLGAAIVAARELGAT